MSTQDKLNDIFNVTDITEVTPTNTSTPAVVVDTPPKTDIGAENLDYDYQQTRNNLYELIQQGQNALIHAIDVAKQSEHPRAFEVVGNLVKQLADTNLQLLDLTEKRQKIKEKAPKDNVEPQTGGTQITNNNAFFVGSTSELNKLINSMNQGDK